MSDQVAHALAGAGGGIISTVVTYPLITVSSRLQVQKEDLSGDAYKGALDAVRKIIKKEGSAGLFSGMNSALFGIAITNGVYYYFYEFAKAGFLAASKKRSMSTPESMAAGAVAGAATVFATNPIWVVNTRQTTKKDSLDDSSKSATSKQSKSSAWSTFCSIIKEDGPFALWQGLVPALILVANPIIQYTAFEQMKRRLEKLRAKSGSKLGSLDFFILGALSKLTATSITYPYIVVKSRMQLKQSRSDETSRYNSVLDGFQKILRQEGAKGLYKGISSKLLQSVLTAAILFMAKEELYKLAVKFLVMLGAREKLNT